jgi:RNA polymerase sigma-B factor
VNSASGQRDPDLRQRRGRAAGGNHRSFPDDVTDTELRTAEIFHRIAALDDEPQRERLRNEVTVLNLPMARRVAARYSGRGEAFEDLYQVACVALVKAVLNFDDSRACAFGGYAVPSMHGEVKRYFRDHGWGIRASRRIQDSRGRVDDVVRILTQELCRPPAAAEIAEATGFDVRTVHECLASRDFYRLVSIDAIRSDGNGSDGDRTVHPAESLSTTDHRLESVEDRLSLRPLVAGLEPYERRLLALRFEEEWTQAQIAREFDVSQAQVSRLLTKILSRLRECLAAA